MVLREPVGVHGSGLWLIMAYPNNFILFAFQIQLNLSVYHIDRNSCIWKQILWSHKCRTQLSSLMNNILLILHICFLLAIFLTVFSFVNLGEIMTSLYRKIYCCEINCNLQFWKYTGFYDHMNYKFYQGKEYQYVARMFEITKPI